MSLLLVRHGQASAGAADYDCLSERGVEQCRRLGRWLASTGHRFDVVVAGRMQRHAQSAAALAEGYAREGAAALPAIELEPGFDEFDHRAVFENYSRSHAERDEVRRAAEQGIESLAPLIRAALAAWAQDAIAGVPESWREFGARVREAGGRLAAREHAHVLVMTPVASPRAWRRPRSTPPTAPRSHSTCRCATAACANSIATATGWRSAAGTRFRTCTTRASCGHTIDANAAPGRDRDSQVTDLFPMSARASELDATLAQFMETRVIPAEAAFAAWDADPQRRWQVSPLLEELKSKARKLGLWNLFLPQQGLSNLDYARLAERMGRSAIGPEACNCSAPDTGNMEVLHLFGSDEQKRLWLEPLLAGEIRSAFAMTEPDVASSDATNISLPIRREGDFYVLDGRKWWTTGAGDPRCRVLIVMGVTNPEAAPHRRQSMILVPMHAPGLKVVRPMRVFGYDDAPHGHVELSFEDVRVPAANLIHAEGSGFEIAQARLGPGRIHHCMRLIGAAQRALEAMVERARTRNLFGAPLGALGMAQEAIALSRCELEQARLLTLSAAAALDAHGAKGAKDLIGMIKIVAPRMACAVIDRAIQMHGAGGLSQDWFLAQAWAGARSLRLADGPDEVHIAALARSMLKG